MNAKDYNRVNRLQMRDGQQLIDKINKDFNGREIECILDIGCGPGNLTVVLNKIALVKRILGVDIDQKMIEFAEQNNSGNNIQYLTQDISLEWNELRIELKEIEGKVSVIFTNYCLHWIYTNRENAIKNMFRLLSKNGNIYSIMTCIPNPSDRIPNYLVSYIFAKFLAIPSKETQENEWRESFKRAGFKIIDYKLIDSKFRYENNEFDQYVSPISLPIYQQFYGYYLMHTFRVVINTIGLKPSSFLPQFKDEGTEQMMCELDYLSFIYILSKK